MKDMTLREVCDTITVSRRAVQGYEKAGLVSASGRNERGHLLYDASSRERIRQIKLFQQLGFSIKEIKDIIDAPNHVIKAALEERIERLKEKSGHIDTLIEQAYEFIEKL